MMKTRSRHIALPLISILLGACASTMTQPLAQDASDRRQLDAGYALLKQLMADERKVSRILTVKSPTKETAALIREIAGAAKSADEQLSAWAKADESLAMENPGLPKVEQSVRSSIESATTRQLLFSGGERFEVALLLSQNKATQYAEHLFQALAGADDDPDRSAWLKEQSDVFGALQERVLDRLAVARENEK